jgi:hypothetical protein
VHLLNAPAMTSESCDMDPKLLISFIEERPVETFKDRNLTLEAWREICKTVHPDFESFDERKKKKDKLFFFVINFSCHKLSMLSTNICGYLRLL